MVFSFFWIEKSFIRPDRYYSTMAGINGFNLSFMGKGTFISDTFDSLFVVGKFRELFEHGLSVA